MKIEFKGQKLAVREMKPDEEITVKTMCRLKNDTGMFGVWGPSHCVGELVNEHPNWEYVEVTSKAFQGLSVEGA